MENNQEANYFTCSNCKAKQNETSLNASNDGSSNVAQQLGGSSQVCLSSINETIRRMQEVSLDSFSSKLGNCLTGLQEIKAKLAETNEHKNETLPPLAEATTSEESSSMDFEDSQNDVKCAACVYCGASTHLPEECTRIPFINRRLRFLTRSARCYRCLVSVHTFDKCDQLCANCNGPHHVSLCRKQAYLNEEDACETTLKKESKKPFTAFTEPPLPDERLLSHVPRTINHPSHVNVQFPFKPGQEGYCYSQLVAVQVHSNAGVVLARALVNPAKCDVSLVSPLFVAKLGIIPSKVKRPIALEKSSFTLNSYAVLRLSSLHRENFHYQRPFYIFGTLPSFRVPTASMHIKALAEERGIVLHGENQIKGHKEIDLVLGRDQAELYGINFTQKGFVHLYSKTESANAYYTHFGYCLFGKRKKAVKKQENDKNETLDNNMEVTNLDSNGGTTTTFKPSA